MWWNTKLGNRGKVYNRWADHNETCHVTQSNIRDLGRGNKWTPHMFWNTTMSRTCTIKGGNWTNGAWIKTVIAKSITDKGWLCTTELQLRAKNLSLSLNNFKDEHLQRPMGVGVEGTNWKNTKSAWKEVTWRLCEKWNGKRKWNQEQGHVM